MKRAVAVAVALIVASSAAAETITSEKRLFSMLCVADQTTGLDWENGKWAPQVFVPNTSVLRKLDGASDEACGLTETQRQTFANPIAPVQPGFTLFAESKGCYSIGPVGEKPLVAYTCSEYWDKLDGKGTYTLSRLECSNTWSRYDITIAVLAYAMTRTYAHAFTGDKRDSLVLEVGKCSFVN